MFFKTIVVTLFVCMFLYLHYILMKKKLRKNIKK